MTLCFDHKVELWKRGYGPAEAIASIQTTRPAKCSVCTMNFTFINPDLIRAIKNDPHLVSSEWRKADSNGHKFKAGDVCTLTGLETFSEYNGEQVTITAIREDGQHGRAYYIEGAVNAVINWVYEYRLI